MPDTTNVFRKTFDHENADACRAFLKNHFRYYTMRSWNQCTSYAHCVKLSRLPLHGALSDKAFEFLFADEKAGYEEELHELLSAFREEHGWAVAFNGRSEGYLVLYALRKNKNGEDCLSMSGVDQDESFDDWEDADIIARAEEIDAFDELCDRIFQLFLHYVEHCEVQTVCVPVTAPKRVCIWHDTPGKPAVHAVPKHNTAKDAMEGYSIQPKNPAETYTIFGYDKDADTRTSLCRAEGRITAVAVACSLHDLAESGHLISEGTDTYDWFEVWNDDRRIAYTTMFPDGDFLPKENRALAYVLQEDTGEWMRTFAMDAIPGVVYLED